MTEEKTNGFNIDRRPLKFRIDDGLKNGEEHYSYVQDPPSKELYERMAKLDGDSEIGAGAPDKSLNAMLEKTYDDLIEESQRPTSKYTDLERKLVPVVVEELRAKTPVRLHDMMLREYVKNEVGNYVDLLDCVAGETFSESYGHNTLKPDSGEQDKDWRCLQDKRLQNLAQLQLVYATGETKSRQVVFEIENKAGEIQASSTSRKEKSLFYKARDYCKKLLEEHRKAKQEGK